MRACAGGGTRLETARTEKRCARQHVRMEATCVRSSVCTPRANCMHICVHAQGIEGHVSASVCIRVPYLHVHVERPLVATPVYMQIV